MPKLIKTVAVPEGFDFCCKTCAMFDLCADAPKHPDYPDAMWMADKDSGLTGIVPWGGGIDIVFVAKLVQKVRRGNHVAYPDACHDYEVSITKKVPIPAAALQYKKLVDRAAGIMNGTITPRLGETIDSIRDEAVEIWMNNL